MIWILSMLACSIGGNTPPRFQSFNDRDVKYLFGFAYLENPWDPIIIEPNARWTFTIDVTDANGDDLEILFPSAPGEIQFDSETMTGYWDVPEDPLSSYADLQVLAVDEQGASDILFVPVEVNVGWDTAWDTGLFWDSITPQLVGDLRVESDVTGQVELLSPNEGCKITWDEVHGTEIAPCPDCERSWRLTLNDGILESTRDRCPALRDELQSTPHEIGFASEVIHNEMRFTNTILYNHPTAGWVPYGTGSLAQHRLNFILEME